MSDGSTDLATLTEAMLAAARAAGAEAADAIAVDGTSLSVDVLNGRLEQAERAEGVEIGLRVMVGPRQASVSASDTRPDTLREMAERAVGMARLAPEDPTVGLADPDMLSAVRDAIALDLDDPDDDPTPRALEDAALRAEAAALAVKPASRRFNPQVPGSRGGVFTSQPATALRAAMRAAATACPVSPLPARGSGWSGITSATVARMRPI
jgi:predicted Zn-dependent protease